MSGAISGIGFPELGQLTAGLTLLKKNFDTLTEQASSGMISNTYAGLNGTASVALSLGPQIDSLTTAQSNIAAARARMMLLIEYLHFIKFALLYATVITHTSYRKRGDSTTA